jgi:hypothetical protein
MSGSGFDFFDRAHTENFCSALLLLAIEADVKVQDLVLALVNDARGAPGPVGVLLGCGREKRTEAEDQGRAGRIDLWLRVRLGESQSLLVVEVKTHCRWRPEEVSKQLRGYEGVSIQGEGRVDDVLLLAPDRLADQLQHGPTITWTRLVEGMRMIEEPSEITKLAMRHFETHIEPVPGIVGMGISEFVPSTQLIACLRGFLLDCIKAIGGTCDQKDLWLTGLNGKPRRKDGWSYHGLSVPFRRGAIRYRLGVYQFTDGPEGWEGKYEGHWIRLLGGESGSLQVEVRFDPLDLSRDELEKAVTLFLDAAREKGYADRRPK